MSVPRSRPDKGRATPRPPLTPMKTILFLLAWCCLAAGSRAAEKIEGAFGLKLGEVFEPTTVTVDPLNQGDGYEFKPDQPNAAFSSYWVWVTPNSHRIYRIVAVGVCADTAERERTMEKITAVLSSKYSDKPTNIASFLQGSRLVQLEGLTRKGNPPNRFYIDYSDGAVEQQKRDEEKANEQARIDRRQRELTQGTDATGF